jgi:PAS domain S-box-containing protein
MTDPVDRVLLDYAQDKIAVIDREGTYVYLNRAAESILGYATDDLVGENAFGCVHPDDRKRVRERFAETIGTEDEFAEVSVEYRHRTDDDGWIWLESRMSNLTDSDLGGYVVSSRDISDRVEAERARDETEVRLQQLAANTNDVLWVFSGDWTELLFINDTYETVYGGSTERLRREPTSYVELAHPDDRPAVEAAAQSMSNGEAVDLRYRVNPDENYGRWVWVQGEPVVRDGTVVRNVGFTRDITDQRRRERQLAVVDNLLRHNLRNDLTTILGQAETILEDPETDPAERAAVIQRVSEQILQKTEKQRETIQLFTSPARPRPIDLVRAIDGAIATVAARYPDTIIETDVPGSLTTTAIPEIEVAFSELIENAVKHAETDESTVRVSARRRDGQVVVAVTDDCPPLPEFEYRVLTGEHEMNAVYHSTGLGLWLVYWVVDLSDGSIQFETNEDSGNTVSVSLPVSSRPVEG